MKYGTYFAYWEQEWDVDFVPYCEHVARLGFDILEVAGGGLYGLDDAQLKRLKDAAASAGIALTACIGLPKEYDVSSVDEGVRRAGIAYMKKLFKQMEKADIHSIGGIIYAYWPCDYNRPFDKPRVREQSIKSVRELAGATQDSGVTMMLETVNRFEQFLINSSEEAVQYVKDVGADNVRVMLDSFHMNIEEDNLGDAIRYAGKYLGHFHIGECNRKVPGKGHMPWDEMGKALNDIGYEGAVVMEPFVRIGGTVGSDIKVWRDISGGADDAQLDEDIRQALVFVKDKFEKQ